MRVGRSALRSIVALATLVIADVLLGRFVLGDGHFLGRPVAPFDPPLFSPGQHAALQRVAGRLAGGDSEEGRFDGELGWCNRPESGFGEFRYDWAGARIGAAPLERVKHAGVRRIVTVGCSMTHGEEVGAQDSWCARLDAALAEVEVANLGVAAYGIDQALLRLRRDGWPLAPDEVWLGVLPQAALRVTTRFRPLLDHWSLDVAFKPAFELDSGGELRLLPNPAPTLADVARLLGDQRALLRALDGRDRWVERAPLAYAPRGSSWTHRSFTARLVLTAWERTGRDLAACFDEDHELGRLYTAIVRTMARECADHDVVFRVVILPGEDDLRGRERSGNGYWEEWAERRRSEGTRVIDLSQTLCRSGVEIESLFEPEAHYTPSASELVAGALAAELAVDGSTSELSGARAQR